MLSARPTATRLLGLTAPPLCVCCRRVLVRAVSGPALCPRCTMEIETTPGHELSADGIDAGYAALPYHGVGRRLVAALKFSRLLVAADLGAALMAARAPWPLPGTIVAVPAAPLRLAARGFDPAAELAGALAGAAGADVIAALRRRDLRRQRGRAREQRVARPPAIKAVEAVALDVLLVDDVVTTGATLEVCASALREAGATSVSAATLAAVPPPRSALAHGRVRGVG